MLSKFVISLGEYYDIVSDRNENKPCALIDKTRPLDSLITSHSPVLRWSSMDNSFSVILLTALFQHPLDGVKKRRGHQDKIQFSFFFLVPLKFPFFNDFPQTTYIYFTSSFF